jgi:hypothetical protein
LKKSRLPQPTSITTSFFGLRGAKKIRGEANPDHRCTTRIQMEAYKCESHYFVKCLKAAETDTHCFYLGMYMSEILNIPA